MVVINQLMVCLFHLLLSYAFSAMTPKFFNYIPCDISGIRFDATQKVFLIRILLRVKLFIQELSLLVVAIEGFDAPHELKREGDARFAPALTG